MWTTDFCTAPPKVGNFENSTYMPDRISRRLYRKYGTRYYYTFTYDVYGYNVGRDLSDDFRGVAAKHHQQTPLAVTKSEFEEIRFERFSGNSVGIQRFCSVSEM